MEVSQQGTMRSAARPSFRSMYESEFDYVWNTFGRLGVAERDREDLTQELFVLVHKKLDEYVASRPIRPWLFAFAFRIASDYRRLARHRVELFQERTSELPGTTISAEETCVQQEGRSLILRAIDLLSTERKPIFIMHELDGIAVPDIADALGIPLNTAYSRLRLARQDFATAISQLRRTL